MVIVPEVLFVKNHIVNTFELPRIGALKATLRQRLLEIGGEGNCHTPKAGSCVRSPERFGVFR